MISITIGPGTSTERIERNKGKSIVCLPNRYVVVDLETTGLSTEYDSIIEIGAVRVCDKQIVERFQTFVECDDELPDFIVKLTGITDAMLVGAPSPGEAIKKFHDFLGSDIVVGYNVSFDINFLYDCMLEHMHIDLTNDYVDCMRIARKLFPEEKHHRLRDMVKLLEIQSDKSHRAVADCEATKAVFERLQEIAAERSVDIEAMFNTRPKKTFEYTDQTKALRELSLTVKNIISDGKITDEELYNLEKWLKENEFLAGNYPFDVLYAAISEVLTDGLIADNERQHLQELLSEYADPVACHHDDEVVEISGKQICLSGDFDSCSKTEFAEKLQNCGAIIKNAVSKKTDYLIVGGKGSARWACGNYGSKIKKAIELQDEGASIKIVREDDVLKCLNLMN